MPLFMVGALPLAVAGLSSFPWMKKISGFLDRREKPLVLSGAALALAVSIAAAGKISGGLDPQATFFAAGAYEFMRSENVRGPFYNDYPFGSSWIWTFDGDPPVFIDGRLSVVSGYDELFQETAAAQKSPESWNAFLDGRGVEAALVRYPDSYHGDVPPLFGRYFPRDRWALVYWDDICLLFVKRDKQNQAVIKTREFRAINPDATLEYFASRTRTADSKLLIRDLERNLRLHPDSRRTRLFLEIARAAQEKQAENQNPGRR